MALPPKYEMPRRDRTNRLELILKRLPKKYKVTEVYPTRENGFCGPALHATFMVWDELAVYEI